MFKQIDYAYPSSITATKNGFGKTGCWFVSEFKENTLWAKGKALRYFKEKADAIKFADTLPMPFTNLHHKYFNN